MSRILPRGALALLLGGYLLLAVSYSVVVPIGRGADEWAHYWYARFIAQEGRLPLSPAEREAAGYKSDWPPLYHLLAAGLTAGVETTGPPTFKYRAESLRRQLVPAQGPEAIIHTEDERFPWRQEILIWHLGRFLSIGFSAGTLLVTYFLARDLFRVVVRRLPGLSPERLALASVAVLAFNPRFLFTGMLFNYDSLTLLLSSLFLWLIVRIVKGYRSRWDFWALGALAGLALVTKYLTLLLPLVILLVAGGVIIRHSSFVIRHPFSVLRVSSFWKYVGQAALAYLLLSGGWFAYLLINFNQIQTYGPVMGTLAPLIRGDGSDRTVEALFAWLSGGQAPAPAPIARQSYTAWQIITELPLTFWGNPVADPYPLAGFVALMTIFTGLAAVGLILSWHAARAETKAAFRFWPFGPVLLLYCALPLPFMLIRLFGARDALEAVQGRHILFLAGPATAMLLVWGLVELAALGARRWPALQSRWLLLAPVGLLLSGALAQLLFMAAAYPPLRPVQTTPYPAALSPLDVSEISLPGGARLLSYTVTPTGDPPPALRVAFFWQGGPEPAPEDYRLELALVDAQGQPRAGWLAYQTQARYPTRVWAPGDFIRDDGWLPLAGLSPGDYQLRWRLLGQAGPLFDWRLLTDYRLDSGVPPPAQTWRLWSNEPLAGSPPLRRERETALFNAAPSAAPLRLVGPTGLEHAPETAGPGWANFIVAPHWPAGAYRAASAPGGPPLFRVAPNQRRFTPPEITHPLNLNFAGKIKLLGYELPVRRVKPGGGIPLTLYWQGLDWMGQEFVIFNRLLDNNQFVWGGYDRLAQENYSTLLWAPGEIIVDGFAVPVEPDAPDGVYTLSLGWYQQVDDQAQSLPLLHPETGEPTGQTAVILGPIKVGGPPPEVTVSQASPQIETNISVGQQIELLGFDLDRSPPAGSSSALKLTFYWQALASPQIDYTVFVHLRDAAGQTVAQKDAPPAGGAYPTQLWEAGEIIKDELTLTLPDLPPGRYELVAGLYDFATGARLPVEGAAEGTVSLETVEVSE